MRVSDEVVMLQLPFQEESKKGWEYVKFGGIPGGGLHLNVALLLHHVGCPLKQIPCRCCLLPHRHVDVDCWPVADCFATAAALP